jgi:hypothetical protein
LRSSLVIRTTLTIEGAGRQAGCTFGVPCAEGYGSPHRCGVVSEGRDEDVAQADDSAGERLTREETLAVLSRVGVRGDRADEVLAGLEFPASKSDINTHLVSYGLNRDALLNQLGGSP